jgi:hypothetical protein
MAQSAQRYLTQQQKREHNMQNPIQIKTKHSTPAYRSVPTDDGLGRRRERDGTIVGDVLVEIDVQGIVNQLGSKALLSARGKSIALGGLVKVTVHSVHKG